MMNRFIELINMPQMEMSIADKLELQLHIFGVVFVIALLMLVFVRLKK